MSWLGAPDSPPTLRQRPRPAGADPGDGDGPQLAHARHRSPRARARAAKNAPPANSIVTEAFRMFGEHCARNQIRTLLIDCLVMTNLFYPSFAAFLERRFDAAAASGPARAPTPGSPVAHPSPLAIFTSPLRETFFPDPPPLLPNVPWGPWWARERRGDNTPWAAEGDAAHAVPPPDGAVDVDVLRVAWADVGHVLDGEARAPWGPRDDDVASAVRALAEDDWATSGAACVRHLAYANGSSTATPSGPCYLLAPDDVELPGATPLSALWNAADHTDLVYRGLAVPFHVTGAARTTFEAEWTSRLADKLKPLGAEVFTETYAQGSVLANATRVTYSDEPVEPVALGLYASYLRQSAYVLYFVLLVGLLSQLSNASKVHSRYGLAFTGVVQLCCSGVMSFSVLALLGWNGWGWSKGQTVLPTYVLPFVIIIVGADSMSTLTKAVFSIPFNYSVPVRIGLALSKVGSTIALTSLTDLALLGVGWLCFRNFQVLREFCVFAAVVIVTDWFMLHTFFLTVLSIDAQRLELADVLASNRELSNAEAKKREEEAARRKANRPARFSWRSVLRARTMKSGSLIIIILMLTGMYYLTEDTNQKTTMTAAASWYGYTPTTTSAYANPTATAVADLSSLSVSEALWRSLNPRGLASIWIGLPRSSIAILPRAGHSMLPADIRRLTVPPWTMRFPSLRPLCHFAKVIIIPQAATAFALYALLLYLLKDSDLLASQRIERETNASDDDSDDGGASHVPGGVQQPVGFGGKVPTAAQIGVFMLPASHASDIDVIAASADGRLAISVGVDNSICLWRFTGDDQCAGTREMVPTALGAGDHPGGPIVAAAVSNDKLWVAVATQYGYVEFWRTPGHAPTESMGVTEMACDGARVLEVLFDDARPIFDDPFTASPVTPTSASEHPPLLVTLTSGGVRTITGAGAVVDEVRPTAPDRLHHVDVFAHDGSLDIIVRRAGSTTVWSRQHGSWSSVRLASSLDDADRVLAVGHATTTWHGVPVRLVALGHRSGNVEVIDTDGELVTLLALGNAPIRAVAIGAPPTTRCTSCDIQSTEGFYVIASTATTVFIDRIVSRNGGPFCRCAPARRAAALEDAKQLIRASVVFPPMPVRSRCLSNGFANGVAPVSASLAPPTTPSDFPVSSHGGRRLSGRRERDDGSGAASTASTPGRTGTDPGRPPSPMPMDKTNSASGLPLFGTMTVEEPAPAALSPDSRWADAGILALGGVQASEGDWAIVDNVVLGVLRVSAGIDDSQWHLWALDLAAPWNGFILMAEAVSLDTVERLSRAAPRAPHVVAPADPGEQSMRARRAERMLSLNGRASFPSSAGGSLTVPTHAPLGYVAVRPFIPAGRTALAGFGNRVGVLALPRRIPSSGSGSGGGGGAFGATAAGATSSSVSAAAPPASSSSSSSTNATPTGVPVPPTSTVALSTPSRPQRNGFSSAGTHTLSPQPQPQFVNPLPPPPPPPRRSIDHVAGMPGAMHHPGTM